MYDSYILGIDKTYLQKNTKLTKVTATALDKKRGKELHFSWICEIEGKK